MSEKGYTKIDLTTIVPDGQKLSINRQDPGAASALLRDIETNKLIGHAPLIIEGESKDGMDKVLAAVKDLSPGTKLVLIGSTALVLTTVSVVAYNWDSIKGFGSKTLSKLRSKKAVVSKVSELEAVGIDVEEVSTEIEAVEPSTEIEISEEETQIVLTPEQWRQLLQSAMTLNSWEEQIWLLLSNAAIEGSDEKVLEWQKQMRELSPEQAAIHVREILGSHPELKDDEAIAELMKIVVRRLTENDGEEPKRLEE